MTAAERLVRNLCEARRQQIEDMRRAALKDAEKIRERVPPSELPAGVRRALQEHDRAQAAVRRAKKQIAAAGFSIPYNYTPGHAIAYTQNRLAKAKQEIEAMTEERRRKLLKLRTDATIDTIGKSPAQVRERLERLRRDVAKV